MKELRLGKLPPKVDARTIQLSNILRMRFLPDLPKEYDIDKELVVVDNNMYLNDVLGDCVIAARGHQTLRFEKYEQGFLIPISDDEIKKEYFKETGGSDSGLIMLLSLNQWRKGWAAAGRTYNIHAYASVDWKNHTEVKHCIHLLNGVYFGMEVSQEAMEQFKRGETWTVVPGDGGILGGHGVYAMAYYDGILVCETWGKRQIMTWEFWDKYVDEAYGIVDNKDEWLGDKSPVDIQLLDSYLVEITTSEQPSNCPVANGYANLGNYIAQILGRKSRFKTYIPK